MIVTPQILARIVAIVVLAVLLQLSFFSQVQVFHTSPDILPAVVVALALLGGSLAGAVTGFGVGLLIDCLLVEALGATSLVLLSVGYLAGRYREGVEITNAWIPPLLAGGFTLLAAAGFAAVELMLGVDASVSILFLREVVVQGLLAVLLAIALYPLIRRILAPALIDYEPARRILVPGLRRSRRRGRGHARITRARTPLRGEVV